MAAEEHRYCEEIKHGQAIKGGFQEQDILRTAKKLIEDTMNSPLFFDVSARLETLGHQHGDRLFQGTWAGRHWMSTPGPIYAAETDNCGTGPIEAPNNIALDKEGFQILYKQPTNLLELEQVARAALDDPFSGYGADGDLHWSYEKIKVWWAEPRHEIEQEVRQLMLASSCHDVYAAALTQWLEYLREGIYPYLRAYAFFLDTGRIPQPNDGLPDL